MPYPYTEDEPDDAFYLTLKPPSWEMSDAEFIALCRRVWEDVEREMDERQGRGLEALARLLTSEITDSAILTFSRREAGLERKRYPRQKRVRWD